MKKIIPEIFPALVMMLCVHTTNAASATWDLNPGSGDWNTAMNWTPGTVPNGSADTATFALSNTTTVSLSANTEVNGITFTPAASGYTIIGSSQLGSDLTLSGVGITNNSGTTQNFVTSGAGRIYFTNSATAGSSTTFTNFGYTIFLGTSTAGNGTFINSGGITFFEGGSSAGNGTFINNYGGGTEIFDPATAANGTFINNGGTASGAQGGFTVVDNAANGTFTNNGGTVSGANGGSTEVRNADNGTFTNNGGTVSGANGGSTEVGNGANGTLIANGGTRGGQGGAIFFEGNSTGGTSRVEVFGNGNLDISFHNTSFRHVLGVTVGSIEGDGNVFLGAKNLTVGSNNMDTTFSGVIQDGGGNGGVGGSLTKIGPGTLDLTGANTYTGNTNIKGGVLKVDGSITSNTFVNHGGTLAGTGTVNGNVTNGFRGTVSPGDAPGTLTVNSYTQMTGGTLLIDIAGTSTGQYSVLNVLGTANLGGLLDPVLQNGFVPTVGEQFIFLKYGSLLGSLFIYNRNIDSVAEHWVVTYQPTYAILTAEPGNVPTPDHGSTLLLLTLALLGVATYRRQLLRKRA